ncbi:MAG TPA: sugar phosphorylase [Anaerolineaceae bacterium]
MDKKQRLLDHLTALYGETAGQDSFTKLCQMMERYRGRIPAPKRSGISQRDAILITYGDQIRADGEPSLQTLANFCQRHLKGIVNGVHILPFYPYSSDDGFSVIDYTAVDPALGQWSDIDLLRQDFSLMFDAVINHISAQSAWFTGFLAGDPRYADYFHCVPDGADLSKVVRPRTLPLLTPFEVNGQVRQIWTTFSADQIDLNYQNPAVLLDILDILLLYAAKGAEWIRLDAIAYLWKEPGTTCIHLPQTHRVIQLIRGMLDLVAPHVALITETNVPHKDNLSYFGDGYNEAQMVYNFALPPLVLHTFRTEDASRLTHWASDLALPSQRATFFNFLASHDGIGLNPARGILDDDEIDALVECTLAHGGYVSYKNNPDGTTSPYEMNINYFDALSDPNSRESLQLQADRFLASQAIMLSMIGVPGIYFHSLFGSRGWREGVQMTRQNRTINRQKCAYLQVETELADPTSLRSLVFRRYARLLSARASHPAFDPFGQMQVLDMGEHVFAVRRLASEDQAVLCFQNVSSRRQGINLPAFGAKRAGWKDLVSGQPVDMAQPFILEPYQTLWLA